MASINGLTNPFENSIMNSNLTQLEKEKQLAKYKDAVAQGYEPPVEVLDEIATLLAADVLSPEAEARLECLVEQIIAELGPVITSDGGDDAAFLTLDEGTSLVTTVTALDRYSLNGADSLTFSIVGGADASLFSIDASGTLTFNAPPDFEASLGGDNVYDVVVQVNDGTTLLDTQTLQITIADVNDTAPVITSAASVTIDENTTAVTTVTSTDPDTVGTVTYAISGGADALLLSIDTATGTLSFVDAPDFEALGSAAGTNVYDVQVTASDGVQSDVQSLSVTVADVDEYVPPATFGVTFIGIDAGDRSGISVSSAGDVNGDGIDDIMIGAYGAGYDYTGAAYVVYGSDTPFDVSFDLSTLDGTNGFTFEGLAQRDYLGQIATSAGDVNGDGFDDILIGAYGSDLNGAASGQSFVVFGGATPFAATFDPTDLDGTNGFAINGTNAGDISGIRLSSAGDVNNDGYDDILVGAYGADPNGSASGKSYVVFGSGTPFDPSIELASLDGSNGFALNGISYQDLSGSWVSSAGDLNGDGIDDILISALRGDADGTVDAGEAYVVFGSDTPFAASIELSSLNGSNGFIINGIDAGDNTGRSVAAAGDVNGDGIDDILIGAHSADPNGTSGAGETYVVFGSDTPFSASFDLSTLDGSNGFAINGVDAGDRSGSAVSSAGDVNNDGFDDILIGALDAGNNAGETYLVFGSDAPFDASINLSTLDGTEGFIFHGIDTGDRSSISISGAGDVNNDGTDDMLIGTYLASPDGVYQAGESYLVYGGEEVLSAFDAADGVSDGTIELSNLPLAPDNFIF